MTRCLITIHFVCGPVAMMLRRLCEFHGGLSWWIVIFLFAFLCLLLLFCLFYLFFLNFSKLIQFRPLNRWVPSNLFLFWTSFQPQSEVRFTVALWNFTGKIQSFEFHLRVKKSPTQISIMFKFKLPHLQTESCLIWKCFHFELSFIHCYTGQLIFLFFLRCATFEEI